MIKENHKAVVRLTPQLLWDLMPFPKGTKCLGWHVGADDFIRDTISLKISHQDLPEVPEGWHCEIIQPEFKRLENGEVVLVQWGTARERHG